MREFEHKGIRGKCEWIKDERIFHGKLELKNNDLVTFEGDNLTEAEDAFIEAVEEYLEDRKII